LNREHESNFVLLRMMLINLLININLSMLIDLFCTEKRGLLQQVIIEYYQNSLYYYYWIEEKYITLIVVRIKYVMEAETT